MFQGFSPETQDFLWGIALNNNREWFLPQKEVYTQQVYRPLKALAFEVQEKLLSIHPELQFNCSVTRIYRDARIPRKDGPYKSHLWFMLRPPAASEPGTVMPGLFFEIEGGSYSVGLDYYCDRPAVMEQFRQGALERPAALETLTLRLQERPEFEIVGPEYKRSKGEVSPLLKPWFNRKRFCVMRTVDWSEALYDAALSEEILQDFLWLLPFYRYLLP